ncbi:hypothetical protein OF83DRAFT_1151294 [Amylostereum chailletii]|nr:hypothetical protein OF83DRAFT_1151294 [Amylostereum chailletii]
MSSNSDTVLIALERSAASVEQHLVGPAPPDLFLERFLPVDAVKPNPQSRKRQDEPMSKDNFMNTAAKYCPKLRFVPSSQEIKTDIGYVPIEGGMDAFDSARRTTNPFPAAIQFVVVDCDVDPFISFSSDGPQNGESVSSKACQALGRSASFAQSMFENAPRVFAFSIILRDQQASFVRWDALGAIYSEWFDWTKTDLLADFFWRFGHLDAAQRGFDTSVTTASKNEAKIARDAFKEEKKRRDYIDIPSQKDKLYRIEVWDGRKAHIVVAGRPQAISFSFGSGIHNEYVGVDVTDPVAPLVRIKDVWRKDSPDLLSEAEVYPRLMKQGVPHLPDFRYGGDVLEFPAPKDIATLQAQSTRTQDFVLHPWASPMDELTQLLHSRFVFGKVGRPLNTFKSTVELCTVMKDAITCHSVAYNDAHILHRNINDNNILIDEDGRGVLSGWERCQDIEFIAPSGKRIGTFEFMAYEHLRIPCGRQHVRRDDLESFMYVMFYEVLRYRPCGLPRKHFLERFHGIFDVVIGEDGSVTGAIYRHLLLSGRTFPLSTIEAAPLPRPLIYLMDDFRNTFKPLYIQRPSLDHSLTAIGESQLGIRKIVEHLRLHTTLGEATVSVLKYRMERFRTIVRKQGAYLAQLKENEIRREKAMVALDETDVVENIFRAWLEKPGWAKDDGAMDQLFEDSCFESEPGTAAAGDAVLCDDQPFSSSDSSDNSSNTTSTSGKRPARVSKRRLDGGNAEGTTARPRKKAKLAA